MEREYWLGVEKDLAECHMRLSRHMRAAERLDEAEIEEELFRAIVHLGKAIEASCDKLQHVRTTP